MSSIQVNKTLINFRIPFEIKEKFEEVCKYNGGNMTYVLTGLIREYLHKQLPISTLYPQHKSTMGSANGGTTKSAYRTMLDDGWYGEKENEVKAPQRAGEYKQNPITKTWEIG